MDESIRQMAQAGLLRLSQDWRDTLDRPLTSEELKAVINKGDGNKAPGRDCIGHGMFKVTWDALIRRLARPILSYVRHQQLI